ncbi:MAG: PIG-L family deacetylase [Gemmatimonadaceae bacterium]|nr:PIG-L family deacetylase [Gemmatimonadaceae bacterium]
MKRAVLALVAVMMVGAPRFLSGQGSGAVSLQCYHCAPSDWRRVLVIGAHPDDEDTQLIAWLQRSGRAETAYLSLTRGDGGQNLIGNELGEALGIIRTEELLAARRVDGAHQFFTRAYDFGFSKSAAETFTHWPKDSLLNDVVKVVRAFRPHVIMAVFSGTPRDGHGQHQVSAILAKEAYESAAADTVRYPVRIFGPAWTPLKIYRFARFAPEGATIRFNVGEFNPALGKSYAEIAGESRSQHKSQGFGTLQRKGVVWDLLRRESSRVNESTDAKSEQSMFDGITAPAPGEIDVPAWHDSTQSAIALEAVADRQYVALGDSARVTATLYNRSRSEAEVRPQIGGGVLGDAVRVPADSAYSWTFRVRGSEITQPWWLATPRNGDLFSPPIPAATPEMIGNGDFRATAEDQRAKRGGAIALVRLPGGEVLVEHTAPIVYRYADPVRGDVQRPLAVMPALSVTLDRANELARANTPLERFFTVTLRSAIMKPQSVSVTLTLPAGLTADSATRTVTLDSAGTRAITFRVHGRLAPGQHEVKARASANGITYDSGFIPIDHDHISPERFYRPAVVALHSVDVKIPATVRIGYIHGVGDNVEPALEQLDIPVTVIEPRAIPTVDLLKFSTVVVGPRAYQASHELVDNNPYLLAYARNGGTLVVQYGQYEMTQPGMMPYSISIARPHDRVTEENAPITIIDAASAAVRRPNVITSADFAGWIQERALYMPRTFDERYHPIVALNDPGEPANRGGIIVTPYGRGLYVYTTLAFFRQLPAGVSGATRLFVNLLAMNGAEREARAGSGMGR